MHRVQILRFKVSVFTNTSTSTNSLLVLVVCATRVTELAHRGPCTPSTQELFFTRCVVVVLRVCINYLDYIIYYKHNLVEVLRVQRNLTHTKRRIKLDDEAKGQLHMTHDVCSLALESSTLKVVLTIVVNNTE